MSVLEEICAKKREHVAAQKTLVPLMDLKRRMASAAPARGFANALKSCAAQNKPALIAEIKRASPSMGVIRADFDPPSLARAYAAGGAACLSVLTDAPYFQGRNADLIAARDACALPVLRKDFMLDEYQIYEACALGADCILLIMAALDDNAARALFELATALGMDALIEVHDGAELDRALKLSPALIGVNSRSLKTLKVDLQTARNLSAFLPGDVIRIAESGIGDALARADLQAHGYQAFLVGESLMRQPDVTAATKTFLAA